MNVRKTRSSFLSRIAINVNKSVLRLIKHGVEDAHKNWENIKLCKRQLMLYSKA